MIDLTSIIEALLTLVVAVFGTVYTYMRKKATTPPNWINGYILPFKRPNRLIKQE